MPAVFTEYPPVLSHSTRRSKYHLVPKIDLASLNPTASSSSIGGSFSHRRRRSSASSVHVPQSLNLQGAVSDSDLSPRSGQTLATIPGTPTGPMSLSRSPSPRPGGGWASPGLAINGSGISNPVKTYAGPNGGSNVTWESAKAKSAGVNGYPSFSTQNNGFFNRHYRRLSGSLPRFNLGTDKSYAEKEKLGRGRWMLQDRGGTAQVRKRVRSLVRRTSRKAKIRILVLLGLLLMIILFYTTRMSPHATF